MPWRETCAMDAYFGVFGGRFRSNPAGDFAAKRHPLAKDSRCPLRRTAPDELILSCLVHSKQLLFIDKYPHVFAVASLCIVWVSWTSVVSSLFALRFSS